MIKVIRLLERKIINCKYFWNHLDVFINFSQENTRKNPVLTKIIGNVAPAYLLTSTYHERLGRSTHIAKENIDPSMQKTFKYSLGTLNFFIEVIFLYKTPVYLLKGFLHSLGYRFLYNPEHNCFASRKFIQELEGQQLRLTHITLVDFCTPDLISQLEMHVG
jgi:hypothetical protein